MFQIRIFGCCLFLETTNEHTYSLTILLYHACQVLSSVVFSAFYTKYSAPFRDFCARSAALLSMPEYICRVDSFFLQYIVYAPLKKYRHLFSAYPLAKKSAKKRLMKKTQNAIFLQPKNTAPARRRARSPDRAPHGRIILFRNNAPRSAVVLHSTETIHFLVGVDAHVDPQVRSRFQCVIAREAFTPTAAIRTRPPRSVIRKPSEGMRIASLRSQ